MENNTKVKKRPKPYYFILVIVGIVILAYPWISDMIFNHMMRNQFDDYLQHNQVSDLEELYQQMVAYNQKLFSDGQMYLSDPFSYEQASFDLTALGYDENIIGYLHLPTINLVTAVYLGASAENMKNGAAQLGQTSLPIGGINTNAVIAGHRGMSSKKMFRNIHLLQIGDPVIFANFRELLHYQVVETKIIEPNDIEKVFIQPGRDLITLLSCHPLGKNSQRYIVYCERVEE